MKIKVSKGILWKGIIEDLVEDFIAFFFQGYLNEIDFEKPIDFLDKELNKIFPRAANKKRHADKLIKVHLKNGDAPCFLIHVEVQGYSDDQFALRMFQSAYRLREKYGL